MHRKSATMFIDSIAQVEWQGLCYDISRSCFVSVISSPYITTVSNTLYNRTMWTTQHALLSSYTSSQQSTYNMTTDDNKTDKLVQTTRKPTGHNLLKTQSLLWLRPQYPPRVCWTSCDLFLSHVCTYTYTPTYNNY